MRRGRGVGLGQVGEDWASRAKRVRGHDRWASHCDSGEAAWAREDARRGGNGVIVERLGAGYVGGCGRSSRRVRENRSCGAHVGE